MNSRSPIYCAAPCLLWCHPNQEWSEARLASNVYRLFGVSVGWAIVRYKLKWSLYMDSPRKECAIYNMPWTMQTSIVSAVHSHIFLFILIYWQEFFASYFLNFLVLDFQDDLCHNLLRYDISRCLIMSMYGHCLELSHTYLQNIFGIPLQWVP